MIRWRYWITGVGIALVGLLMIAAVIVLGSVAMAQWAMFVNGMAMGCFISFVMRMCDEDDTK